MSLTIPFSAACERNKDIILQTIDPLLNTAKSVLEIGSGTGQHAIYFANHHPQIFWQTSDQAEYLHGLSAQLENANCTNVMPPLTLNVNQAAWYPKPKMYDVIYTANTLHIMSWSDVETFFTGLHQVAKKGTALIVYGPFKYNGEFTSHSNAVFDQTLRGRGVGSAIRDFETVDQLAETAGFSLINDHKMPANNQCLIWRIET